MTYRGNGGMEETTSVRCVEGLLSGFMCLQKSGVSAAQACTLGTRGGTLHCRKKHVAHKGGGIRRRDVEQLPAGGGKRSRDIQGNLIEPGPKWVGIFSRFSGTRVSEQKKTGNKGKKDRLAMKS